MKWADITSLIWHHSGYFIFISFKYVPVLFRFVVLKYSEDMRMTVYCLWLMEKKAAKSFNSSENSLLVYQASCYCYLWTLIEVSTCTMLCIHLANPFQYRFFIYIFVAYNGYIWTKHKDLNRFYKIYAHYALCHPHLLSL